MSESNGSTVLRRFAGPEADELAILCRPDSGTQGSARQTESAYRALAEALATQQTSFRDVASETLFVRDVRELPSVLAARTRVLTELGHGDDAPLPAFIGQAPLDDAAFATMASLVIPRDRSAWGVSDIPPKPSCACDGCAQSGARLIRLGEQVSLHTTNLYGAGGNAYEQALDMFRTAERMLERCGMSFHDVVRTWIHLRDIDRDYDALNAARREFFRQSGLDRLPASTGVEGIPFPDRHDFSLSLQAMKSSRALDVEPMSTPLLNEAPSYGSDFSRGLRLVEANRISLHVSGTASIDEQGRTANIGEIEAQTERMIDNVESLLARQGATFGDLLCGVTYLKRPSDAALVLAAYRRRGLEGFPCAFVGARLCRPELLCEAEVVAMLSRTTPEA